jgi:hypothetical protein
MQRGTSDNTVGEKPREPIRIESNFPVRAFGAYLMMSMMDISGYP